jgi:hypothetical protein
VGKEILKVHPDYPKLKTEIIDKARSMLKSWMHNSLYS